MLFSILHLIYYTFVLLLYFEKTLPYRTSTCFHENEEFSLCGWRCPVTCVNIGLLYRNGNLCSSKWECHVGCRCSAGYIRDEHSKNCVFVQNCPVSSAMALVLLVCLVLTAAVASPVGGGVSRDWQPEQFDRAEWNKLQEIYPTNPAKRSHYGSVYVSPCAAAASAPVTAYGPVSHHIPAYPSAAPYHGQSYHHTVPAHHGYAPPHYAQPYYRMEDQLENEQEMLEFPDTNQVQFDTPMARSSYGPSPIVNAPVAASGPVVGVFSNANTGGCSVPLLVSCSPSIAHGRIVKSQPQAYYNGAYRDVEQLHHDDTEEHKEKAHLASEHSTLNSNTIGEKHQ